VACAPPRHSHGPCAPFTGRSTSKNVLVIGSQTPWVKGLCLAAGAGHDFTLEYGKLATDHPDVTVLTPEGGVPRAWRGWHAEDQRRGDGLLASSLEHAGLGRYSDGLNPWGDILALARAWCVSSAHAQLVIAVPTLRYASGREAFIRRRRQSSGARTCSSGTRSARVRTRPLPLPYDKLEVRHAHLRKTILPAVGPDGVHIHQAGAFSSHES
jgi:hypothetical protein